MRIASTSPDITEILCALNLFENLIGISTQCDWPPEIQIIPRISDGNKIDLTALKEVKPDIVITSTSLQKEIVRTLTEHHMRALALHSHTLQNIFDNIRLLGNLFDRQFEAGEWVSRMKREFILIRNETSGFSKRPRIFCEEWGNPITVGIGWTQEMIEIAGGTSPYLHFIPFIESSKRTITASDLVKKNPEIILIAWRGTQGRWDETILQSREGWSKIDAVRNRRVYSVNDVLYVRAGPRLIEGTQEIFKFVKEFQ
jgi:iron complex transport system substrate-binding protein